VDQFELSPSTEGVMLSSRSIWHGADAQLRQPIVTMREILRD
jgi:hypothetical protein